MQLIKSVSFRRANAVNMCVLCTGGQDWSSNSGPVPNLAQVANSLSPLQLLCK